MSAERKSKETVNNNLTFNINLYDFYAKIKIFYQNNQFRIYVLKVSLF